MKNIATIECYAVPGSNNIIDTINPDTGLTFYYGRTEAEIQAKEPGAVRMTLDAWRAEAIARQHTLITWEPSTEERYDDMLNVLPPFEWRGGAFCVGEPYDHDLETGEERYQAYWHRGAEYLASSRPVTRRELRAEVDRAGVTAQEQAPPERGLLTKAVRASLPPFYSQEDKGLDALAVVKFFDPGGSWTWYASEFNGVDTFYGLVDGHEKELGYFSLAELSSLKGRMGLPIERDKWFTPIALRDLMKPRG